MRVTLAALFRTGGIAAVFVLATCQNVIDPLYEPVVTFTGYYNDTYVDLPGHGGKPNTCSLKVDTVEIRCYSKDYDDGDPDMIQGYRLWMQIHPFTVDTTEDFWTGHLRVRFNDYATLGQFQTTRVLYPADTAWGSQFNASGIVRSLERRVDGTVDIDEIRLPLHNENQAGVAADIDQGELYGTIER
ncbi:MAG: hypothetical protein GF418_13140 [Chitinivibrionales bacterium]|nr:hypothetical protein [Chitinivibrionales bacterium]MBD3396563.1 hypothetical protein [Chitinivibrionales bacterium]